MLYNKYVRYFQTRGGEKLKVLIEDNLYIEGDHQNIEVRRYTGKQDKKTGNDLYVTHGYYPTVEQAVEKVFKMKLAESQATNLKELSADIKSIKQWLKEKLT